MKVLIPLTKDNYKQFVEPGKIILYGFSDLGSYTKVLDGMKIFDIPSKKYNSVEKVVQVFEGRVFLISDV